jgi:hypothetical protein
LENRGVKKQHSYSDNVNWIQKQYEDAILQNHENGLDEEMKKSLITFLESQDSKALYYETARMIGYPQPLWWVRLIVNWRLSVLIKESSLIVVKPILLEELIRNATRVVIKKPANFSRKNDCYSNYQHKYQKKPFQFVKLSVKKLETFLESWRSKKL